jgi:hypothetical protein
MAFRPPARRPPATSLIPKPLNAIEKVRLIDTFIKCE